MRKIKFLLVAMIATLGFSLSVSKISANQQTVRFYETVDNTEYIAEPGTYSISNGTGPGQDSIYLYKHTNEEATQVFLATDEDPYKMRLEIYDTVRFYETVDNTEYIAEPGTYSISNGTGPGQDSIYLYKHTNEEATQVFLATDEDPYKMRLEIGQFNDIVENGLNLKYYNRDGEVAFATSLDLSFFRMGSSATIDDYDNLITHEFRNELDTDTALLDRFDIIYKASEDVQVLTDGGKYRYDLKKGDTFQLYKKFNGGKYVERGFYINGIFIDDTTRPFNLYVSRKSDLKNEYELLKDFPLDFNIRKTRDFNTGITDTIILIPIGTEEYDAYYGNDFTFNMPENYSLEYPYVDIGPFKGDSLKMVSGFIGPNGNIDFYIGNQRSDRIFKGNNSLIKYRLTNDVDHTIIVKTSGGQTIGIISNYSSGDLIPYELIKSYKTTNEKELKDFLKWEYYYDMDKSKKVNPEDIVDEDLTIYRFREFNLDNSIITINFDTNGGNTIDSFKFDVSEGQSFSPKIKDFYNLEDFPIPTKSGYHFLGWEVANSDWEYDFMNYSIESTNVELKANWAKLNEDIYIVLGDYQTIYIKAGETISKDLLPDLVDMHKLGKRFLGWNTGDILHGDKTVLDLDTYIFYESVKLYAKYEDVTNYNISFDVNGGVYLPNINVGITNAKRNFKAELPTPEKSKAVFGGWFLDEELTIPVDETVDYNKEESIKYYDITLYASWINNASIINFHTNGGPELSPIIITKGHRVNISNPPKREGYLFNGWFLDEEMTIEYNGEEIYEDEVNLHASWITDGTTDPNEPGNGGGSNEKPTEDIDQSNLYLIILVSILGGGVLLAIFGNTKKRRR